MALEKITLPETYNHKQDAIERAKKLTSDGFNVAVVLSRGIFYVDNESTFIRTWETLLFTSSDGEIK